MNHFFPKEKKRHNKSDVDEEGNIPSHSNDDWYALEIILHALKEEESDAGHHTSTHILYLPQFWDIQFYDIFHFMNSSVPNEFVK